MHPREHIKRRWFWALALALVAAATALWLHRQPFGGEQLTQSPCEAPLYAADPTAPDLILITVDTLRPDHLGAYGHASARTPRMDRLAASGVRFAQATTPMPRTTPALASLFTGLRPSGHGSRDVGQPATRGETLATLLCEHGYSTFGVSASWVAGPSQQLDRGFARFLTSWDRPAEQVTRRALEMTDRTPAGAPLFLWVHYTDPHMAYLPPAGWKDQPQAQGCRRLIDEVLTQKLTAGQVFSNAGDRSSAVLAECVSLYDAEIAYTDFHIGALLEGLRERRDLTRAFVVLTADHGESLGEKDLYYEHGPNLHDASLRVPLLIAGPGLPAGLVDEGVARLEDVMPTVLTLLGISPSDHPAMDGLDLSPRFQPGGAPPGWHGPTVALAESGNALNVWLFGYLFSGTANGRRCFNDVRYSLCWRDGGPPALYDHVADPKLTRDLGADLPQVEEQLLAASRRWHGVEPRRRSARTPEFKLVEYPSLDGRYQRALYDLRNDPNENHDVSAQHPEVMKQLGAQLEKLSASIGAELAHQLDAERIRTLEAMGYID